MSIGGFKVRQVAGDLSSIRSRRLLILASVKFLSRALTVTVSTSDGTARSPVAATLSTPGFDWPSAFGGTAGTVAQLLPARAMAPWLCLDY